MAIASPWNIGTFAIQVPPVEIFIEKFRKQFRLTSLSDIYPGNQFIDLPIDFLVQILKGNLNISEMVPNCEILDPAMGFDEIGVTTYAYVYYYRLGEQRKNDKRELSIDRFLGIYDYIVGSTSFQDAICLIPIIN
jgi:hypothetical protein